MAEDRMHQEISKQEVTREHLEETIVNLVPVPLQSKGKAVIEHWLRPGLALSDTLARLSLSERLSLQEVSFNGYKPDRFEVRKKPYQTIFPCIKDMQTLQEVQSFLRALQGECYRVIDNGIVERNWETYRNRSVDLFSRVDKDLLWADVFVDQVQFKGSKKDNAQEMCKYLLHAMSEEAALKTLAQIQGGIFVESYEGLKGVFQHSILDLHILPDSEKAPLVNLTTIGDHVEIHAQRCLKYQNSDSVFPIMLFNVKVSLIIPKNGSQSNGHWIWEVVEAS